MIRIAWPIALYILTNSNMFYLITDVKSCWKINFFVIFLKLKGGNEKWIMDSGKMCFYGGTVCCWYWLSASGV